MSPYFDAAYFDAAYFDADGAVPPVHHGGTRARWRRIEDVMREWRIRQDDEEFFLIE